MKTKSLNSKEGRRNRYTFAGSVYFKRMQEQGLYTVDKDEIIKKVEKLNLYNIMNEALV